MSLPGAVRRHSRPLDPNQPGGVPVFAICEQEWDELTTYDLCFTAELGNGTPEGVTVTHSFLVDEGTGQSPELVTLTTSFASGLVEHARTIFRGIAKSLRVTVQSVPDAAWAAERPCTVTAAVAERR